MYRIGVVGLLIIAACGSGETSPAGPLGRPVNLRSRMTRPEDAARAPADASATPHELLFEIHGVKVKLVWRTFDAPSAKYILSASWEILAPRRGITLWPVGPMNSINVGTEAAPVQSETLGMRWADHNSSFSSSGGEIAIDITAAGAGRIDPNTAEGAR